jgi:hypothetical protein
VGVLLNSVDPEEREAYSFYWGVLPQYRKRRSSMSLVDAYLSQVRREGYLRTYADYTFDSPAGIYRKLGYRAQGEFLELQAEELVRQPSSVYEVRNITVEELVDVCMPLGPGGHPWTARAAFLHNAPFLEGIAAYDGARAAAWAVLTRWPGHTLIVLLGHTPAGAEGAWSLLSALPGREFPPPYHAAHVLRGSSAHEILMGCGFRPKLLSTCVALDLVHDGSPG